MSRRKGINSRNKGASFERKVARQIAAWCKFPVTRTPQSGGWAKTGDVTPKHPENMVNFPFNFELKNNQAWYLSQFYYYDGKELPKPFIAWWKQCCGDAKKSKRTPVLVFTKNHRPEFCVLRASTFRKLQLHKRCPIYTRVGPYRIFLWEELLKIPYERVLRLLGNTKK